MRWSEEVVGIDFSDDGLSASRVTAGGSGSLCLLNAGWARVDPSASPGEWAAAIRQVWRSAGMASRTVCASLHSRSALLRYFRYPALDPVELASALGLEAEESLQLPREEIVMDWHLSRPAPTPGSTEAAGLEGLLVAASRKHVRQQLAILRMAGLYPVAIDLGAAAIGNLYVTMNPDPASRENVCILHLTRHHAEVVLLFEEEGLYARTLYPRGPAWEASLDPLVEGLQDALKYHVFKLGGHPASRVLVSGLLPETPGFLAMLQDKTNTPVERWDPLTRIQPGSSRVRRLLAEANRPPIEISMGLSLRRYDGE